MNERKVSTSYVQAGFIFYLFILDFPYKQNRITIQLLKITKIKIQDYSEDIKLQSIFIIKGYIFLCIIFRQPLHCP